MDEAIRRTVAMQRRHFLILDDAKGWSLLRNDEAEGLMKAATSATPDGLSLAKPAPTLYPDQPLEQALRFVQDCPLLPVVSRSDSTRLEGVVTLEDILQAYRKSPAS